MMIAGEQQQDEQPDGAMVLGEDFQPPRLVNVDVSEDLLATQIPREKKTLFWVPVGKQDRTVCALLDTSASRNLISQRDYEALPQPPTLRPPGTMIVVAGNNQEIPLLVWITLRFSNNTRSAYHDFGVVKNRPIDMLIGGEFPRTHECQIMNKASGRNAFEITDGSCYVCLRNKEQMKAEHDPQLQATPKRTTVKRRDLSCVVVPTRLRDEQERRREKLCKVLAEVKIDFIPVSHSIRHQVVSVLARRLDSFAVDDDDGGHTTLIEHRIETGNSLPFRQRARPVPYARRIFIESAQQPVTSGHYLRGEARRMPLRLSD